MLMFHNIANTKTVVSYMYHILYNSTLNWLRRNSCSVLQFCSRIAIPIAVKLMEIILCQSGRYNSQEIYMTFYS